VFGGCWGLRFFIGRHAEKMAEFFKAKTKFLASSDPQFEKVEKKANSIDIIFIRIANRK